MDVSHLYFLVTKHYVFNGGSYPGLKNVTDDEKKQAFILNHVLLHAIKQTGKLANLAESFDHEGTFRRDARDIVRDASARLIVDAIQFAAHFGVQPEELESAIKASFI